jgi:hypothetical protein
MPWRPLPSSKGVPAETVAAQKPMKSLLLIAGILLLALGLLFAAQGSGYFPYPAESFMVGASNWVYYGGAIALIGIVLIFASRF